MVEVSKVTVKWSQGLPSGLTWYFIGQPKTGKTTAAASWSTKGSKAVLMLDTEQGTDFVEGANRVTITSLNPPVRELADEEGKVLTKGGTPQYEPIPALERGYKYRGGKDKGKPMPVYSFAEVLTWLSSDWELLPYDTIVIDTVDSLNSWVERIVCAELGTKAMGDAEWGADWGRARQRVTAIVEKLQGLVKKHDATLIMISHSKQTTVVDGKSQIGPELPRGLASGLLARSDVIGYTTATKNDGHYYINFRSYEERMIGSRLKPLSQQELLFDYKTILETVKKYKEIKENGSIQTEVSST